MLYRKALHSLYCSVAGMGILYVNIFTVFGSLYWPITTSRSTEVCSDVAQADLWDTPAISTNPLGLFRTAYWPLEKEDTEVNEHLEWPGTPNIVMMLAASPKMMVSYLWVLQEACLWWDENLCPPLVFLPSTFDGLQHKWKQHKALTCR